MITRATAAVLALALFAPGCTGDDGAGAQTSSAPAKTDPETTAPGSETSAAAEDAPEQEPEAGPSTAGAAEAPLPEPDLPPQRPPEYGILKPPVPPPTEEELTLHGLAGFEVVPVFTKPDGEAPRMGWLRLGTRLRVTKKVEGPGCPKGWHGLEGGGFACARFLHVDSNPPYMHREPPAPRKDTPLPYDYAFVRRWNSAMYWRIPNAEEMKKAAEIRAEREAERQGLPPPGAKPAPAAGAPAGAAAADDGAPDGSGDATEAPKPEPEPEPEPEPKPEAKAEPAGAEEADPPAAAGDDGAGEPAVDGAAEAEEEEPVIELPMNADTPWLEKGFFLSVGGKENEGGRNWWRTARGGYVLGSAAAPYEPKDFKGQVLDEIEYPFGWAMDKPTRVYVLEGEDKLKPAGTLEQRTFVDLDEEVEIRGKSYMVASDGKLLRKQDLRIPELQPLPKGLEPWERWIDVSLERQLLVAYEGTKPVFATLVSTGRKGTEEEPFDTPTGRWRIRSKHISTTMDGNTASDGNYSIQDVPWAMYFEGSYALHGAFWHRGFGYRRSHGCVNLGPSDAKFLFFWTTPYLPDHWHGVNATTETPGTTVIIRE